MRSLCIRPDYRRPQTRLRLLVVRCSHLNCSGAGTVPESVRPAEEGSAQRLRALPRVVCGSDPH